MVIKFDGYAKKSGRVTMDIAENLLGFKEGDRIATVAEYAERFKAARGTVQSSLKLLEDSGAISLESRGHLGTYLIRASYDLLCGFAGMDHIMGVMPLPYSKLYEGLATGLYNVVKNREINLSLAYMRGAERRITALEKGKYDFAIVSKLAAAQGIAIGKNIEIAMEFGRYSYVNEHVLVFSDNCKKDIEKGMKIGLDRTSIDHYLLTIDQCCKSEVELIEMPYNQIISKLLSREIDAAVWNIDEIMEKKISLKYYPLKENIFEGDDTEAVMIIRKDNDLMKKITQLFINSKVVCEYQKMVIRGELVPNY